MTGTHFPRRRRRRTANALALAAALSLFAGCGAKNITVGSVPFPAEAPVFVDEAGNETAGLPRYSEPIRLVFLDSPWCPQCGEAWASLGAAASTFPPGSVRVYRILFDREWIYERTGTRETPPLHPAAAPVATTEASAEERLPVTTLRALSGPFRKQFRVSQTPVLLLLDRTGSVAKRWIGASPSLADALAEEVRRITASPPQEGK